MCGKKLPGVADFARAPAICAIEAAGKDLRGFEIPKDFKNIFVFYDVSSHTIVHSSV